MINDWHPSYSLCEIQPTSASRFVVERLQRLVWYYQKQLLFKQTVDLETNNRSAGEWVRQTQATIAAYVCWCNADQVEQGLEQ